MSESKYLRKVLCELSEHAGYVEEENLQEFVDLIIKSERIFVCGAGRSGFIARGFANRLMHLGFTVYFVGEPTTPAIREEDLLIVSSGSGGTGSLVTMARKAKDLGAKVALVTIFPDSVIGQMADHVVVLPGETPKSSLECRYQSFQPMGNLFEQLSWLTYDSVIMMLMEKLEINAQEMFARHANLE